MVCCVLEGREESVYRTGGGRGRGGGMCRSEREGGGRYRQSWCVPVPTSLIPARIRRKWGDKSTIGAADESPEAVRKAGGLQIIYLPPGHTMTPVSFVNFADVKLIVRV